MIHFSRLFIPSLTFAYYASTDHTKRKDLWTEVGFGDCRERCWGWCWNGLMEDLGQQSDASDGRTESCDHSVVDGSMLGELGSCGYTRVMFDIVYVGCG